MINKLFNIRLLLHQLSNKGFFHLLSANVLIQVFTFASQLFVAGILSPEDIGRIKIIQTYLAVFSILAAMGFNASTLKICSEGRPEAENRRYLNSALLFTLISSLVFYLMLLIANHFKLLTSDQTIQLLIPLGLFPLITNSLFMVLMAYFQAGKNIRLFSILTIINKLISIVGIILLTWYLGIRGYYIAYNLSFIVMLVAALIVSGKLFNTKRNNFGKEIIRHHWNYARSSVFANIAAEASAYLDILLISFLSKDMEEIGYYSFALTLTIALRIFPATVQQITLPYFSEKSRQKSEFLTLYKHYDRLLLLVIILSLIVFLLLIPGFLQLLFGDKYDASLPYLYILSIGWSIRSLNQLRSSAIFGMGKIKYNGYSSTITLIFNLISFPLMINWMGLTGAAYATIASGIVIYTSSVFFFKKAVAKTNWEE